MYTHTYLHTCRGVVDGGGDTSGYDREGRGEGERGGKGGGRGSRPYRIHMTKNSSKSRLVHFLDEGHNIITLYKVYTCGR